MFTRKVTSSDSKNQEETLDIAVFSDHLVQRRVSQKQFSHSTCQTCTKLGHGLGLNFCTK